MSDLQTGLARCYRHPMRETGVRCVRCNRPICPDCMRPASVGFMCPDDVRLGNATIRRPRTAVGARVPRSASPVVSWSLIGVNVAVFLATFLTTNVSILHNQGGGLLNAWNLTPQRVLAEHQYYRLVTATFLHWSVLHLASNMLVLAVVGPAVEQVLGRWRFLVVYLLSGLGSSVAVLLFANPFNPVAGASGAVFGLFGAALALQRRLGASPGWLVGTLVLNLAITFIVPFVSVQAHLGGLVAGALAGAAIGGLPGRRDHRPSSRVQATGLVAVFVVLLVLVVVRAAV